MTMMNSNIEATITKKEEITKDVIRLVLKLNKTLTYQPGQYIMLSFQETPAEKRAFSILDYDASKKELILGIKLHAEFTKKLFQIKTGTKLNVHGPYGRFTIRNKDTKNVFIAGGIGITPIYNLIKNTDLKAEKTCLMYSSRTKEDMPFLDLINKLPEEKTKKHLYFTRQKCSEGENKHITCEEIIKLNKILDKEKNNTNVYICGPKKMIESLREQLIQQEVPIQNIISEEF